MASQANREKSFSGKRAASARVPIWLNGRPVASSDFERRPSARRRALPAKAIRLLGSGDHYSYSHSPDGVDTNLIVLLHGSGDTHVPYERFARRMALPQTACLSLGAGSCGGFTRLPFDLGHTYFEELDYVHTGLPLEVDHPRRTNSLKEAVAKLSGVIFALLPARRGDEGNNCSDGWIAERVFLFGFSCGACLAMETGLALATLRGQSPRISLGGIVCVAGGIRSAIAKGRGQDSSNEERKGETPVLILAGGKDETFPASAARNSAQIYFEALQWNKRIGSTSSKDSQISSLVKVHIEERKGHTMIGSRDEMQVMMEFISKRLVRLTLPMDGCIEILADSYDK